MAMLVKTISVTVGSKRQTPSTPYGSANNSFTFVLEDSAGISPEEAVLLKIQATRNMRRLILLEDLAQGLITPEIYEAEESLVKERYKKVLAKFDRAKASAWPGLEEDPP